MAIKHKLREMVIYCIKTNWDADSCQENLFDVKVFVLYFSKPRIHSSVEESGQGSGSTCLSEK